jgi:transposase
VISTASWLMPGSYGLPSSTVHIVANMNEALDDVRAAESHTMAQEGHEPLLKKSRWCVLKRRANVSSQPTLQLRDLLRYNLQTICAYLLKEDVQRFWDHNSPALGGPVSLFLVSGNHAPPYCAHKENCKTQRAHRGIILN